jgi:hypothetical protein
MCATGHTEQRSLREAAPEHRVKQMDISLATFCIYGKVIVVIMSV